MQRCLTNGSDTVMQKSEKVFEAASIEACMTGMIMIEFAFCSKALVGPTVSIKIHFRRLISICLLGLHRGLDQRWNEVSAAWFCLLDYLFSLLASVVEDRCVMKSLTHE